MMGMGAAGMGLGQTRLLNFLADEGGHGLAEAAVSPSQKAILVTCGNGVYAWMQELWPHWEIAMRANSNQLVNGNGMMATNGMASPDDNYARNVAWLYHDGFSQTDRRWTNDPNFNGTFGTYVGPDQGYDNHMVYGPHAPWMDSNTKLPRRPVSALMAGNDETHTPFPASGNLVSGSSTMSAVIGAIQVKDTSAIVPTIGIDPLDYGSAAGAPDVATVPNADGIIGLFNSAASKFVLDAPADQKMFETYYKAMVGLRRSAARSAWQPQLQIAKGAARLIGLNFATALTPSEEDLNLYGVFDIQVNPQLMSQNRDGLDAFARTMIVVAKAFKLGLSDSAVVGLSPGPTSDTNWTDPHNTFNSTSNIQNGRSTTMHLGQILDAFYEDLAVPLEGEDPPDVPLDESTVFITYGDTPHSPSDDSAWPDATPSDCNWVYVMDPKGYINDGWYGGVTSQQSNNNTLVNGFNTVDGTIMPGQSATLTSTVTGALASYCVAKGDWNTVAQFYPGAKPEPMLKA